MDTLSAYEDRDLLVAYSIGDKWVPAPTPPTPGRRPCGTFGLPYPQADQWIPNPTADGDVEPNPGPSTKKKGGYSLLRTLTQTSQTHTRHDTERAPRYPPPPTAP